MRIMDMLSRSGKECRMRSVILSNEDKYLDRIYHKNHSLRNKKTNKLKESISQPILIKNLPNNLQENNLDKFARNIVTQEIGGIIDRVKNSNKLNELRSISSKIRNETRVRYLLIIDANT